jgi:hypothetical protein
VTEKHLFEANLHLIFEKWASLRDVVSGKVRTKPVSLERTHRPDRDHWR